LKPADGGGDEPENTSWSFDTVYLIQGIIMAGPPDPPTKMGGRVPVKIY
jgi:hypothetical protein